MVVMIRNSKTGKFVGKKLDNLKGGDLQSGQERGRRLQKRGPGVLKKMKK